MELLIPGLILVALMAWASTKIKKRAADAFEVESIETDSYSLRKPEGFLHVLGDSDHEFYAYSREFGEETNSKIRRATIEIDVMQHASLAEVRNSIKDVAVEVKIVRETSSECELETEESANENAFHCFYKIVASQNAVHQLRFAILPANLNEYSDKARDTLDSFSVRSN